jgi:hypothetical protein
MALEHSSLKSIAWAKTCHKKEQKVYCRLKDFEDKTRSKDLERLLQSF